VTITGSTTLKKEEVEKMVQEAEANAEEDRQKADDVSKRNQADSLIYSAEKNLRDHGDKLSQELREEVTQKADALKEAVAAQNSADIESRQAELSESLQKIGQAVYQNAAPQPADGDSSGGEDIPPAEGSAGAPPGADGDVVDAEFKEV
jgi:molecular chaperone DnaK